jgi:multidrug resistance efflux pump
MRKRSAKKSPAAHRSIRHHLVPVVVWLMTVALVFSLFLQRSRQVQVLGIAHGKTHRVSATCTGRIHEVMVQLYDTVNRGQTLLTIDTLSEEERLANTLNIKELETQEATLKSNIEFLRARLTSREEELVDQAVRSQTDRASAERVFSVGVETARMQLLDLDRELAGEQMELGTLEGEVETLEYLARENAIPPYELTKAKQRLALLQAKIDQVGKQQEEAQQNLAEAQARQREFMALPPSPLAGDVAGVLSVAERIRALTQKEILVEEQRLAEIEQRLANLRVPHIVPLVAPFDGTVSHLYLSPGGIVDVNMPAMQLAQLNPTEVIAYVPESHASRIKTGMRVEVVKNSQPMQIAPRCEVIAVGPVIEQLPAQLWLHPNIPQWGRSFVVRIPATMNLLVGEKVGIREL